jgi:hypothetical protein
MSRLWNLSRKGCIRSISSSGLMFVLSNHEWRLRHGQNTCFRIRGDQLAGLWIACTSQNESAIPAYLCNTAKIPPFSALLF